MADLSCTVLSRHHGNELSLIGIVLTMGLTTTPSYSSDCANASLAVANSFSGCVSDSRWRSCFAALFLAIDTWTLSGSHCPLTVLILLTRDAGPARGFSIVCCASASACRAPLSRACCAGPVAVEEKRCGRWGQTKCSHRAIEGVKRLWARHIRRARECCIGRETGSGGSGGSGRQQGKDGGGRCAVGG